MMEADGEQLVLLTLSLFAFFWVAYFKVWPKAIGTGGSSHTALHPNCPQVCLQRKPVRNGSTVWWLAEPHSKAASAKATGHVCVCVCALQLDGQWTACMRPNSCGWLGKKQATAKSILTSGRWMQRGSLKLFWVKALLLSVHPPVMQHSAVHTSNSIWKGMVWCFVRCLICFQTVSQVRSDLSSQIWMIFLMISIKILSYLLHILHNAPLTPKVSVNQHGKLEIPLNQNVFYFEFPLKIGVEGGGVPLTVPKLDGWAGECATEVSVTMCGTTSLDN